MGRSKNINCTTSWTTSWLGRKVHRNWYQIFCQPYSPVNYTGRPSSNFICTTFFIRPGKFNSFTSLSNYLGVVEICIHCIFGNIYLYYYNAIVIYTLPGEKYSTTQHIHIIVRQTIIEGSHCRSPELNHF